MDELFMSKNVETSMLQPADIKSFKVGAKHIKKAAKKARQKATKMVPRQQWMTHGS